MGEHEKGVSRPFKNQFSSPWGQEQLSTWRFQCHHNEFERQCYSPLPSPLPLSRVPGTMQQLLTTSVPWNFTTSRDWDPIKIVLGLEFNMSVSGVTTDFGKTENLF